MLVHSIQRFSPFFNKFRVFFCSDSRISGRLRLDGRREGPKVVGRGEAEGGHREDSPEGTPDRSARRGNVGLGHADGEEHPGWDNSSSSGLAPTYLSYLVLN